MLCERCGQREANIKYTEVVNGVRREHNLCMHCAKELDLGGPYAAIFEGEFPLGQLLSGLLGIRVDEEENEEKPSGVFCPSCHTTYEEFIKNSRFGCPDCYHVFDLLMSENIKTLQGNVTHTGKKPRFWEDGELEEKREEEPGLKEQLEVLSSRLKEAIEEEEYEAAARYRDEIRELKERMNADA